MAVGIKSLKEQLKKIDKATIIRIVTLVIAVLNQAVSMFSKTGFASTVGYRIFAVAVVVVTAAWNAWENNDITLFARVGTKVLDALEDGEITVEEVETLLKKDD